MDWLSIDTRLITLISIGYLVLLFLVAHWGQKLANRRWAANSWVYALSLGVSCTSWAFYGIIGQASITGQWLAPIYLGTIGFFILAWPVLLKMLRISKQQNLTSIADFIACRFEGAPAIAAIVSIISLLGTIPYISLQLRAVSQSFELVTGSFQSGANTTFAVTLVLIGFSILFGARTATINKQNQGLVFAIAFSSLIKLVAIIAVGIFATFYLFDGFDDLLAQQHHAGIVATKPTLYLTVAQIVLGALTIFTTPQLYHMIVIENNDEQSLAKARWLYPLFLILINIFVLPIALAGQLTFPGGSVNSDTFILTLPLYHHQAMLSLLVYIGGLAAATAMVIIAAIVLSNMLTTELLSPLLIRLHIATTYQKNNFSALLLLCRRLSVATILLLSFAFERMVNQQSHLSNLGLLAFVLLAQFSPAVLAALYWRKASSVGATLGLLVGSLVWAFTLFVPEMWPNSSVVQTGLFAVSWLKPTQLFGIDFLDSTSHGVFFSLLFNVLCFVGWSLYSFKSVAEKLQADLFIKKYQGQVSYSLTVNDLVNLLRRFINESAAQELLVMSSTESAGKSFASPQLIDFTQKKLTSVLGSASTRLVMKVVLSDDETDITLGHVANIVDEANQLFEFNRELLQAAIENIEQGISVVDADMRLVAWNTRYVELLCYPSNHLKAGMHIEELLAFNVKRGMINGASLAELVARRIRFMQAGKSHYYQRKLPNGKVVEIRGQAMPGGGFVSTFSDITMHIEAEIALQKANESLEQRVFVRTKELSQAKAEAEAANRSKTRFLAAASHDLMQPFNALSLFSEMLAQRTTGTGLAELTSQIQTSLASVEALLFDLVEISKLDSGVQKLELEAFALNDVLAPLSDEISAMAAQHNIQFHYIKTAVWVNTDKRLLRRVVQNFLSNAIHYVVQLNKKSKVVLGVRRRHGKIEIDVLDNGPGIAFEQQQIIFNEFERLETNRDKPGLGLGLAIAHRIAKLLNLPISLQSVVGQGSVFSLLVERAAANKLSALKTDVPTGIGSELTNVAILLIDNDKLLLSALAQQISAWGCKVTAVTGQAEWQRISTEHPEPVQLIIVDYHLDDGNGIDLAHELIKHWQVVVPCIICSADTSEAVRQHCSDAGFSFIKKPLKALALKRLIKQLL